MTIHGDFAMSEIDAWESIGITKIERGELDCESNKHNWIHGTFENTNNLDHQYKILPEAKTMSAEQTDESNEIERLKAEVEKLTDKLDYIKNWINAYSVDMFSESDLQLAHKVLFDNGMSFGSISALGFRYVLSRLLEYIEREDE